jgi:hypothetical protein
MSDLKFAVRQLLKNPGFSAVAVLTLALGIGATSSVFALMQGALLTPPPYAKPERIALISSTRIDGQSYARGCAAAQWLEWKKEARSLEAMADPFLWSRLAQKWRPSCPDMAQRRRTLKESRRQSSL